MTAVRWCKRCGEEEALSASSFCTPCHGELDGVPVAQMEEAVRGLELLALKYRDEDAQGAEE